MEHNRNTQIIFGSLDTYNLVSISLRRTGEVVGGDVAAYLAGQPRPFDLVFVDPPYAEDRLPGICRCLENGWLAPSARVYLEGPAAAGPPALPAGWSLSRSARAGQVGYHLAHFAAPRPAQAAHNQEQQ